MKRTAAVLGCWLGVSVAGAAWAQTDGGVAEPSTATPEATALPSVAGDSAEVAFESGTSWKPELFGYLKVGYFLVVPPSSNDFLVGSNSGFRIASLRVGVDIKPADTLQIVLSLDGALPITSPVDPLTGNRIVAVADAYAEWTAHKYAKVRVGQFKAPFDGETLLPDGALPFIFRSIITDGLFPPEGYPEPGLTLDRQIGLQVSSETIGLGPVGVRYAVALVNGNGANVLHNDNNLVAPVGRLEFSLKDRLTLGLNAYYNVATVGVRPNRIIENQAGWGGDVAFSYGGFHALAVLLGRSISHPTTGLPNEHALGVMGSLSYFHKDSGFEGGVRAAYFDPSNVRTGDDVLEVNAMVGYRARRLPARVLLEFTYRGEEPSVGLQNNSIDAELQLTF